jgi:hypothetical protein
VIKDSEDATIATYDNLFYGQYADTSSLWGGSSAEGDDDYVVTTDPVVSSISTGQSLKFIPDVNNTGACTITPNGIATYNIKTTAGVDPSTDDIVADQVTELVFDGTNMVLVTNAAINGANITAGTVDTAQMADSSITEAKITDGAVTADKITTLDDSLVFSASDAFKLAEFNDVGTIAAAVTPEPIVDTATRITSAGASRSVELPAAGATDKFFCMGYNDSAYDVKLYPASGDYIGNTSSGSHYVNLSSYECFLAFCVDGTTWVVVTT